MHTQTDLQRAFNRAKLANFGYTLESALANKGLAICLNRLADNYAKRRPAPAAKSYWYNNI